MNPDRVGDEIAPAVVLESPRCRVERLEEPVVDRNVRVGQGVEKGRLPRVRVAGERDDGRSGALARLSLNGPALLELAQPPLEEADASTREPSVGLELRLARPARADAAAEALEVLPHAPHAREVVLELRELDLELALGTSCVLGEDVEDQLRAIDDAGAEGVLQAALLPGLELVVDDQRFGVGVLHEPLQLLELALPT